MNFETFANEMKKSLVKSEDYYLCEIEEIDDLQPYGKAYFFFEEETGETPKEYMLLDKHDELVYLIKKFAYQTLLYESSGTHLLFA